MCWVCDIENLKAQIANKNINVYKVVKEATKKYCVSPFMEYTYYLKDIQPYLTLRVIIEPHSNFAKIKEGYYSYESVNFVLDSLCDPNFHGFMCKTIVLGTHKELLGINNPIYLATFIIPKGSIYFVNPLGVIVSSRIKYTGRYLKL